MGSTLYDIFNFIAYSFNSVHFFWNFQYHALYYRVHVKIKEYSDSSSRNSTNALNHSIPALLTLWKPADSHIKDHIGKLLAMCSLNNLRICYTPTLLVYLPQLHFLWFTTHWSFISIWRLFYFSINTNITTGIISRR